MCPVRSAFRCQIDGRRRESSSASQRPARAIDKNFNGSGNGTRSATIGSPCSQHIVPGRHVAPRGTKGAVDGLADFGGARKEFDERDVAIRINGVGRDSDVRSRGEGGIVTRTCKSNRWWIVGPWRAEGGGLQGDVAIRMRGDLT